MRTTFRIWVLCLVAFATMGVGVQQVQAEPVPANWNPGGSGPGGTGGADPIITFSFTDLAGDAGYGTLNGTPLGNGTFGATSGTLIVTAGQDTGTYALYQNSSFNTGGSLSPSAYFIYDNVVYPSSNTQLDNPGLLFAAGGFEINIYSSGPGSYVFYDNSGHNSPATYVDAVAVPVPEPGSCTLCGFAIVSFGGMAWRKRKATLV